VTYIVFHFLSARLSHKNEAKFEAPQMRVGTAAENKHLYWSHKIMVIYKMHQTAPNV